MDQNKKPPAGPANIGSTRPSPALSNQAPNKSGGSWNGPPPPVAKPTFGRTTSNTSSGGTPSNAASGGNQSSAPSGGKPYGGGGLFGPPHPSLFGTVPPNTTPRPGFGGYAANNDTAFGTPITNQMTNLENTKAELFKLKENPFSTENAKAELFKHQRDEALSQKTNLETQMSALESQKATLENALRLITGRLDIQARLDMAEAELKTAEKETNELRNKYEKLVTEHKDLERRYHGQAAALHALRTLLSLDSSAPVAKPAEDVPISSVPDNRPANSPASGSAIRTSNEGNVKLE
ncbi:hypothetical protein B0H63DRAFT_509802 [Podospora didyma]|uniref:Uncharacterized protein n=1 Tax=Podospora didyma TaxID=330526 RepID=A0AAE0TZ62_9PEZI|nr:hypothetical protein B0H63DRAFT_509802 [Podospora didyma]